MKAVTQQQAVCHSHSTSA